MSVHVSSWAWQTEVGDDGCKLVLLKLADQANDLGAAFPGRKRMAAECECTPSTIRARLERLERMGLLERVQWFTSAGRQTTSTYLLAYPVDSSREERIASLERDGYEGMRGGVAPTTPPAGDSSGGRGDDPSPVAVTTPRGVARTTPLEEPSEEPGPEPSARTGAPRERDLVWDLMVELFGPVTPRTNAHEKRNKAVADLKRLGADVDGIRYAVARWPSVFNDAAATDIAIATHYPQLVQGRRVAAERPAFCDYCGTRGGGHASDCVRPRDLAAA